jgi:hypothetical protein
MVGRLISRMWPSPACTFFHGNVDAFHTFIDLRSDCCCYKAEQAQAEVYYVAPRFTRWDAYVSEFQSERVLEVAA